ncbi:MAG: tRNA (guanosine(46)-N7)-methyltransferase TrmB [Myxococcota bacterium]|jgi:tRNA (guanine-N7-)-methyltransferase|nr:tRNA (guanosine(46)-N7)-methyltransferase TrmB [Myxococcota bacterium]
MGRSLKYEIPGVDRRCDSLELAERGFDGLFAAALEDASRRVLEIGFGRGEFLLELAAKQPETAFLGVEISFKRVLKMARKVGRAELCNVRLMEAKGEVVLHDLLPNGLLDEIWVNFSDPWPKDRHARRRVIQPAFVRDAARCLVPGGTLHVATDDVPYAHQIAEVMEGEILLENAFAPERWLGNVPGRIQTGYEIEWRAAGRPLHFFAGCRVAAQAEGG